MYKVEAMGLGCCHQALAVCDLEMAGQDFEPRTSYATLNKPSLGRVPLDLAVIEVDLIDLFSPAPSSRLLLPEAHNSPAPQTRGTGPLYYERDDRTLGFCKTGSSIGYYIYSEQVKRCMDPPNIVTVFAVNCWVAQPTKSIYPIYQPHNDGQYIGLH
jgi:hypothetical protein